MRMPRMAWARSYARIPRKWKRQEKALIFTACRNCGSWWNGSCSVIEKGLIQFHTTKLGMSLHRSLVYYCVGFLWSIFIVKCGSICLVKRSVQLSCYIAIETSETVGTIAEYLIFCELISDTNSPLLRKSIVNCCSSAFHCDKKIKKYLSEMGRPRERKFYAACSSQFAYSSMGFVIDVLVRC